jgi:hypothetical protein
MTMGRSRYLLVFAMPVLLLACATTGGATATTPHVVSTTTTTELDRSLKKRTPVSSFSLEDGVVCIVDFAWTDVTVPAGSHTIKWRWYKEETLVSQSQKKLTFNTSPYSVWTSRAATSLGPGRFRVETLLDEQIASSCEFQIKPQQ